MSKSLGPCLCRIETPYLLRAELRRTQRALTEQTYALKKERAAHTHAQQALAEAKAKVDKARAEQDQKDFAAEAKAYFFARIRERYHGGAPVAPVSPADEKAYFRALQHRADGGDIEAQYIIGVCSLHGWATMQLNANAVQWLRRAAQQGHADASFRLGLCLNDGKGVAKDPAEGRAWIQKAASTGLTEAVQWIKDNPTPSKMKFSTGKPHLGK